jgi:hypothetical protein
MLSSHAGGPGFESLRAHQYFRYLAAIFRRGAIVLQSILRSVRKCAGFRLAKHLWSAADVLVVDFDSQPLNAQASLKRHQLSGCRRMGR